MPALASNEKSVLHGRQSVRVHRGGEKNCEHVCTDAYSCSSENFVLGMSVNKEAFAIFEEN
jgi:uncharacterized protein YkuJ